MASETNSHNEQTPLLGEASSRNDDAVLINHRVVPGLARRLYLSHFLSTWNSRVFEFGAVLYLATIFPGTLLPMSVYAIVRSLSSLAFASLVGRYIDTENRLKVVRTSIVYQRLATAVSCVIFYLLATRHSFRPGVKECMLVILTALACTEKLCSIMNRVSVEKDWVVVICNDDQQALRTLNASMRRIDLLCKLFGPLCIALLDGWSTQFAILFNFAINIVSVGFEYISIAQVYQRVPSLQIAKESQLPQDQDSPATSQGRRLRQIWNDLGALRKKAASDFSLYFHHSAFLPSFTCTLLNFTVLSFGAQMVTYLLSAGYTSGEVAAARTVSVVFEVLATWIAPWVMSLIGPVRAGLWFSSLQVSMLIAGTAVFLVFMDIPIVSASGLVVGTILSRIGLWGFDLSSQVIVQEDVEPENRGAFSSVEAAWQSMFEMLGYISTAAFHRPDQFRWPVLMSVAAIASSNMGYTLFLWRRRGHLFHLDRLAKLCGTGNRQEQHEAAFERVLSNDQI